MQISRPSAIGAGILFTGAGIAHFAKPDFFESIVPDWFPDAALANRLSGAAELAFGLGMFLPRTCGRSALGLFVLTVAVFPANVDMAVNNVEPQLVDGRFSRSVGTATGPLNWVRLPLQLPLLWWLWREYRAAPAPTR
ncbi:MAG: putative membrane protein [Ilumatobacter sp.]|jgi:uncharacterized membrane protein